MNAAGPHDGVSGGEASRATHDDVSEESISEHITSASGSVENDRSLREIEVTNRPGVLFNLPTSGEDEVSRVATPDSFEASDAVTLDVGGGVKSILEEILNNEQFRSEQSFDLFANVNFDDDSLVNVAGASLKDPIEDEGFKLPPETDLLIDDSDVSKRIKCLEEMLAVKEIAINALNSEIDSLKEWSNTFTSSMVSATEYKQLQQDCSAKLIECDTILAQKNDMIRELTESLEQSVNERKTLLNEVQSFKQEVGELREKLKMASETLDSRADNDTAKLKAELSELKDKHESDRERYEAETARLRNLLETVKCGSTELVDLKTELELKHSQEVEELRTYFEKKCAELEKNYSEEIFSQQSRKLSGSSSDIELSDDLLLSNRPGPGGDSNLRLLKTKEDAAKMAATLTSLLEKMSARPLDDDKLLGQMEAELRVELGALLKIGEKLEIKAIQNKYLEEISNLKYQLDECNKRHVAVSAAIQEVGSSSGEFEIGDIVQSYERRLQEQITVAKIDLVSALDAQFQRLLADDLDDEEWPSEFLLLRDRFASKHEAEIARLVDAHRSELDKLKEEHSKALERATRRSRGGTEGVADVEVLKERDALRKQAASLRGLIAELVKYFGQCEDALNDTLVEELVKHGADESFNADESSVVDSLARVHLTPDFGRLISRIEEENQPDVQDISSDLRNELGSCLEKLRQDANVILAMTSNVRRRGDESPDAIEKEKAHLEDRLDHAMDKIAVLETELQNTRTRLAEMIENGRNEVVSEAYGEAGHRLGADLGDAVATLEALQEKARSMATALSNADPAVLQLMEELCQAGSRVADSSYRERCDLLQQIDVADRKYKSTARFLEEQATEREQERDDAQKIIVELRDKLRDRDRDRVNRETMSREAENLERQLEEAGHTISEQSRQHKELRSERDEAVDKINYLRDIIRELEAQNEERLSELRAQVDVIDQLRRLAEEQENLIDELRGSDESVAERRRLRDHVDALEDELRRLRVVAELAGGDDVVKRLKIELSDLERDLDDKTKGLELLHSTANSCSSPSEDMSVRDVVARAQDDCELPLQQLARLKEKLVKHSRAEEAAAKRIRDLEMQVKNGREALEEARNERECMKREINEHVVLISSLQIRLDQQRLRAEYIEKQTNTSLEGKIYDLHAEIEGLRERVRAREQAIEQRDQLLRETRERLEETERELSSKKEDELLVRAQRELEEARRDLRAYADLDLDVDDLRVLAELKRSGATLSQTLSAIDLSRSVERARKRDSRDGDDEDVRSAEFSLKKAPDETVFMGSEPELSDIEKVGPTNVNYTIAAPLGKPNSTEIPRSTEKKVHFEVDELRAKVDALHHLEANVSELQARLDRAERVLEDETRSFERERDAAAEREQLLGVELAEKKLRVGELEREVEELRRDGQRKDDMCMKLARERKDVEDSLVIFKRESFDNLDAALNEKNVAIVHLQEQLSKHSDEAKQLKVELEGKKASLKTIMELFNTAKEDNDKLNKEAAERDAVAERLGAELRDKEVKIAELRDVIKKQEAVIIDKDCEVEILTEDLKQLEAYDQPQAAKIHELIGEVSRLQEIVREKERIIVQITEDHGRLHANLKAIEAKIKETGNILDLAARLKAEQKRSADLLVELHGLRAKLLGYETAAADPAPIDEITGQLKRELEQSVRIDSNIMSAVSDRSASSLSEGHDLEAYRKSLSRQKARTKQLIRSKEQLEKERATLEHRARSDRDQLDSLQGLLDKERAFLKQTQIEDANLIEQLRIRLDAALDAREDLERLLEDERSCRRSLEAQIEELKKPASSSESTTRYKALPSEDAAKLRRELEAAREAVRIARADLKELTLARDELENNLKYTNEVLMLEAERNRNFEEKVRVLGEKEKALQLEALQTRFELNARTTELEERRVSMEELEAEKALLERQKEDLTRALLARASYDAQPETLEKLIGELKAKTEENKKKVEYIALIESDKRELEAQLRSETRDRLDNNVEFRHLKARCDYLFAKTLKLESLRKSLIWQKRYLMDYYHAQSHRWRTIEVDRGRGLGPLARFRSAAFVAVSLARMRFLVRRWHHGVRIAEKINARHSDRPRAAATTANFQVGQPVSNQHFVPHQPKANSAVPGPFLETSPASNTGQSAGSPNASWSGLTPPSRDARVRNRLKIGAKVLKKEDVTPLKAPQLLAQFQDRIHELQEKFAGALEPE